jgi:magnesium-transporting ATPase (P-type)
MENVRIRLLWTFLDTNKLQEKVSVFGKFFEEIFIFVTAYSHMIPISLYIALELLKLMQAYLIKKDPDIKVTTVRNSELIEELGQVRFIFSDKTGTLTCNRMEFKKCSVNGVIYGENITDLVNTSIPNLILHVLIFCYRKPSTLSVEMSRLMLFFSMVLTNLADTLCTIFSHFYRCVIVWCLVSEYLVVFEKLNRD